jgi:ferredoxin
MIEKTWRVEVSRACVGTGLCLAAAPNHFQFVEGRSEAVSAAIEDPDDLDLVRAAAELCPTSAISLLDSRTG